MAIQTLPEIQQFCQLLLHQEITTQSELFKLYQFYLFRLVRAFRAFYSLSQTQARLSLQDDQQGELSGLDIVENFNPGSRWVPYTSPRLALFDGQGTLREVADIGQPRLALTDTGACLWAGRQAYSLQSLLYEAIPVETVGQGPFDLYIPGNRHEMLFITDRGNGTLSIADTLLTHLKATLKIRSPGHKKAINLAYSTRHRQCYITDHLSPDLMTLNVTERAQHRIYQNFGILGNLVLDEQRDRLYVMLSDRDKEPAILIFAVPQLEHLGTILLPGKRFSLLDDPCDLMALTPDGQRLLVMSYSDSVALVTPVISLIDTATYQLLHTQELKKEEKPLGFAFLQPGPTPASVPDFDELLLEKGLISQEQHQTLLAEMGKLNQDRKKAELDKDVSEASARIAESFTSAELASVTHISEQASQQLLEDQVFQWTGRDTMTREEKAALVDKIAALETPPEVSHTNGIFVLNWLKGLLQ